MAARARRNLVIGQSGGATAVINSSLSGVFEEARESGQFEEVYGMHYGIEGLLKEDLIDLRRQPATIWAHLRAMPAAALGSCRYKLDDEDADRALAIFERYEIHDMLYLGGNDSANTAHRMAQAAERRGYDLRVISVPKTIDNDLPYTDHCPGYGTAARFFALSTMYSTMNMLSLPDEYPVKAIETMGSDAGWLVAASALGKRTELDPPHLLLLPEKPFDEDTFLAQVEDVYHQQGHVIIVTSEALRDEKGQTIGAVAERDAFGHVAVSGAAEHLAQLVKKRLNLRANYEKYGDLQWSEISQPDRSEAYRVGEAAVKLLLAGETDRMVTLVREPGSEYHCTTSSVEIAEVADQQRFLPDEFLNAEKTMVTRGFYDYAMPLIGDQLPIYRRIEMIRARP